MDRKMIAAIHVNRATSLYVSFIWFIFALHLDNQHLEALLVCFLLVCLPVRVLALFSSVECGAFK